MKACQTAVKADRQELWKSRNCGIWNSRFVVSNKNKELHKSLGALIAKKSCNDKRNAPGGLQSIFYSSTLSTPIFKKFYQTKKYGRNTMYKAILTVCLLNHAPHIETDCFNVYDLQAPQGYNKINDYLTFHIFN